MRLTREINQLAVAAPHIPFPQVDVAWERFVADLRHIVAENIGPEAARILTWDACFQVFTFTLTEPVALGGFLGSFQASFLLDPRQPLRREISRLIDEVRTFHDACAATWRASAPERDHPASEEIAAAG